LLGVFLTDGCTTTPCKKVKNRCHIISKDKDWLKSISMIICNEDITCRSNKKYLRLNIGDKKIVQWLIEHGCNPRKTLTLEMPPIPLQYLPDFIRGCIDGDGSISHTTYKKYNKTKTKCYLYKKTTCYLCGASKVFIDQFKEILTIIDIKSSLVTLTPEQQNKYKKIIDHRNIIAKNNIYRVNMSDSSAYKFLKWIYYDEHKLSMPRKLIKAKTIFDYYDNKLVLAA
jgi:hypothetical protein